ncbi:Hypothetical_protein [Hexamita inflata]|uniref:Hypothetical_protein n=1 Tax=Hexamita inflata TaxID=28002 RepID=A0ABP1GGK8_9EUKA
MLLHLEEAPSEERVNARFSCAFIGVRALAFLGLFLLGRQVLFSLFQDVFNVLDFVQRLNFLLEYSAMIFRYEISLVERLHNDHQVRLYLRDLHVRVVFCVVLYNIFKFSAQFFLVQFGLKLFFRDHLSNFASQIVKIIYIYIYIYIYHFPETTQTDFIETFKSETQALARPYFHFQNGLQPVICAHSVKTQQGPHRVVSGPVLPDSLTQFPETGSRVSVSIGSLFPSACTGGCSVVLALLGGGCL